MGSARVHHNIALSKGESGDVSGALESARESVRIYTKLGIADDMSQKAADLFRELQDGVINDHDSLGFHWPSWWGGERLVLLALLLALALSGLGADLLVVLLEGGKRLLGRVE